MTTDSRDLSGDALNTRTIELLAAAERVSRELEAQNKRLADAIELFHRDVLVPLREGRSPNAAVSGS